jgi:hypothetical protein
MADAHALGGADSLCPAELRLAVPDEAQDASYLAASARIASFCADIELGHAFFLCSNALRVQRRWTLEVPRD